MATVRKLSRDEVDRLQQPSGRVDLTPYTDALSGLVIGDWGSIELLPGDRPPVVKRRYSLAAHRQGKRLIYKRQRGDTIPFEVRALTTTPTTVSSSGPHPLLPHDPHPLPPLPRERARGLRAGRYARGGQPPS